MREDVEGYVLCRIIFCGSCSTFKVSCKIPLLGKGVPVMAVTAAGSISAKRKLRNACMVDTVRQRPERRGVWSERKVATSLFLVLLIAICLLAVITLASFNSYSMRPVATKTIVVHKGDTLWSIAREVAPSSDPRRTVYYIKKFNGLQSSHLKPRQQLRIPVSK